MVRLNSYMKWATLAGSLSTVVSAQDFDVGSIITQYGSFISSDLLQAVSPGFDTNLAASQVGEIVATILSDQVISSLVNHAINQAVGTGIQGTDISFYSSVINSYVPVLEASDVWKPLTDSVHCLLGHFDRSQGLDIVFSDTRILWELITGSVSSSIANDPSFSSEFQTEVEPLLELVSSIGFLGPLTFATDTCFGATPTPTSSVVSTPPVVSSAASTAAPSSAASSAPVVSSAPSSVAVSSAPTVTVSSAPSVAPISSGFTNSSVPLETITTTYTTDGSTVTAIVTIPCHKCTGKSASNVVPSSALPTESLTTINPTTVLSTTALPTNGTTAEPTSYTTYTTTFTKGGSTITQTITEVCSTSAGPITPAPPATNNTAGPTVGPQTSTTFTTTYTTTSTNPTGGVVTVTVTSVCSTQVPVSPPATTTSYTTYTSVITNPAGGLSTVTVTEPCTTVGTSPNVGPTQVPATTTEFTTYTSVITRSGGIVETATITEACPCTPKSTPVSTVSHGVSTIPQVNGQSPQAVVGMGAAAAAIFAALLF